MKKIFKLLPVFFLSLFAVSCEEYEAGSDFVQDLDLIAFVQYSSNTYTVTEDAQFYDVRVQATSVSNVDRTINIAYTFDENNLTNEVFTSIPATVTIPAGQLEGALRINFDHAAMLNDQLYTVTFTFGEGSEAYTIIENRSSFTLSINKACEFDKTTLNLVFDEYASETEWEVYLASDLINPISFGGGYEDGDTDAEHSLCLAPGDYFLVIYDAYGDGFCCSYGSGSYSLTYRGEVVISGDGQIGASQAFPFTIAE